MGWLSGLKNASVAAICIVGVVACGDDDKGHDKLSDSGSPVTADDGDGQHSGFDSGLDGSLPRDAATVLPDGMVIVARPDTGTPSPEPDASAPAACPGGCNDNVECTIDSCVNGACQHRVDNNVCGAGTSCSLTMGCQPGKACASNADCEDMDGCTTRATCNMMAARCEYDLLDRDGDGYPPVSCGGTDCNDDRGRINPSAAETCDGVDNDCDGTVDDVTLAQGATCTDGKPGCADGYNSCGPLGCVNLQTSNTSCGACGNPCIDGEVCTNGECTCPLGGSVMMCQVGPISACANITTSELNCGACGTTCDQGETCLNGACTACGGENEACCDVLGLSFCTFGSGLTCSTDGKCECGAGHTKCGETCVDLTTSFTNCGACGNTCERNEACVTEGGATECKPCGGAGQHCCNVPGLPVGLCRNGLSCGGDQTCVVENAAGNGPGGPGIGGIGGLGGTGLGGTGLGGTGLGGTGLGGSGLGGIGLGGTGGSGLGGLGGLGGTGGSGLGGLGGLGGTGLGGLGPN